MKSGSKDKDYSQYSEMEGDGPEVYSHLGHLHVVHAVPEAVGGAHEAEVVAAVHGVARVHQHPKQFIHLGARPPIAQVRCHVQVSVKIDLQRQSDTITLNVSAVYT